MIERVGRVARLDGDAPPIVFLIPRGRLIVAVGAVGDVNGDGDSDALELARIEHVAVAVAVKLHDHDHVHGCDE